MTDEQILMTAREVGWNTEHKASNDYLVRFARALMAGKAEPEPEPVAWMSNKDFNPIRIRIMCEAYDLADRGDSEGYNAIKVMCGDVQRMLPPQRTWVGLTDAELAELSDAKLGSYDLCLEVEAKLKEKNNGS